MRYFLLLLIIPFVSAQMGIGCTTAWYLDKDCDGYGTGPGVLGRDADDSDPEVNTPDSVIDSHGTLSAFLEHKGYRPERIFYISKDGDNNDAEIGNMDKPFASFTEVEKLLEPTTYSEMIIYREGVYTEYYEIPDLWGTYGSEDKPIYIMAYPGEEVVVDGIEVMECGHIFVDGLIVDGGRITCSSYDPIDWPAYHVDGTYYITFRNIETRNSGKGIHAMYDLHYITVEDCVMHNNGGSHAAYFGAQRIPNDHIRINRSIFTGSGDRHGFQHNGRVRKLAIENSIFHSNYASGISLIEGTSDSIIRNNLLFNNRAQGFVFYFYKDDPYEDALTKNNLIVNNIIYQARSGITPVLFSSGWSEDREMQNNTFMNNIIVTKNSAFFKFWHPEYSQGNFVEKNILYRIDREAGVANVQTEEGVWSEVEVGHMLIPGFSGNLLSDPMFVNPPGDYVENPEDFSFELDEDSPAVDWAAEGRVPEIDIKYRDRIGVPDAGCYEFYPAEFVILTNVLPIAITTEQYSAELSAYGGQGMYQWQVTGLPQGLDLVSNTIIGTTEEVGEFEIIVTVTDAASSAEKTLTLVVEEAPVCIPSTEICDNYIDEDCDGHDSQCICSDADTDRDNSVNASELKIVIDEFIQGDIGLHSTLTAIEEWKMGC